MLSLIGLLCLLYLVFKFLPDFLMFLIKACVFVVVLVFVVKVLAWVLPFNIMYIGV